jgi:hypothetical protein
MVGITIEGTRSPDLSVLLASTTPMTSVTSPRRSYRWVLAEQSAAREAN